MNKTLVLVGLLIATAVGIVLWLVNSPPESWEKVWGPHIAVAAFAAFLTITVIDKAVRGEQERRTKPRRDSAHDVIEDELTSFVMSVTAEYARSFPYVGEDFKAPLGDELSFLLTKFKDVPIDVHRGVSVSASKLAAALDGERARNSDVLEEPILAEIDKVRRAAQGLSWATQPETVRGLQEMKVDPLVPAGLQAALVFSSAQTLVGALEQVCGTLSQLDTEWMDSMNSWAKIAPPGSS